MDFLKGNGKYNLDEPLMKRKHRKYIILSGICKEEEKLCTELSYAAKIKQETMSLICTVLFCFKRRSMFTVLLHTCNIHFCIHSLKGNCLPQ